jgi:hypothetical protein
MIDLKPPPTNVKHYANIGDIIAAMPSCKTFYEATGRKVKFMQTIGQKAQYYPGATHPTLNDEGEQVCVNQKMFDMIKPLIEVQPYIDSFVRYEGQEVNLDFDKIRGETFVNLPHGMIQSWLFFAFPDLACDLSKQWIFLPEESHPIQEKTRGKVILNFTERYRNYNADYFFLKEYAPDLIFAGTDKEYWAFCSQWQINVPRLEVNDFLEYAYAIKGARFFMGNQSFGWNLCEAMKTPRLLEVCNYAANCMPFIGEKSYGFYHNLGANFYFKKLYNDTK